MRLIYKFFLGCCLIYSNTVFSEEIVIDSSNEDTVVFVQDNNTTNNTDTKQINGDFDDQSSEVLFSNSVLASNDFKAIEDYINRNNSLLTINDPSKNIFVQLAILSKPEMLNNVINKHKKEYSKFSNIKMRDGKYLPQFLIMYTDNYKTFKIFLEHGMPNVADQNGQLPIHYSAVLNKPKYSLDLLQYNNELYVKDKFGYTPRDYIFRKFDITSLLSIYPYFNQEDKGKVKEIIEKIGNSYSVELSKLKWGICGKW